jgi:hypothetical protein
MLGAMPSPHDRRHLLEQRPRPVEVLYFDRTDDEEPLRFHRCVRGD